MGLSITGANLGGVRISVEEVPPAIGLMELTVDTTFATSITLPIGGTYDITVDWGDGTINNWTSTAPATVSHNYAEPVGFFQISITGTMTAFGTQGNLPLSPAILSIDSWNDSLGIIDFTYAFSSAENLDTVPNSLPSTARILKGMFYNAPIFNQFLNDWDTSSVTNMNSMFAFASAFEGVVTGFDTSSVTDMAFMFQGTLVNQFFNDWDVSKVTDMSGMFNSATRFDQWLKDWDTSSVTAMNGMFQGATRFNQDLTSWPVPLIPSEPPNFSTGSALQQANKPIWGTTP